jgi:hypothetical protein
LMCRQRERVRGHTVDGGGGGEGKREYANGGGVVSRGLVGRLQPRFPGATLCTLLPPASSLHPDPTSTLPPPLSLSLSLSSPCVARLLCFAAFLCSSCAPKAAALTRYRKIITPEKRCAHACGKPRDSPTELH